ncbi:hypothetical protein [Nakamurella deserti]|uniref:hypothetical protein n=1 Tax=Nakamurella deserti TaxID=2164074 RepID=UPI000DBE73FA|nr:hypothetical protein [Nakamurella deserti]
MTTTTPDTTDVTHADGTPPMSAPTYRACACGWSTSGGSHSSAVDLLQEHLAPFTSGADAG